MKRTRKLVTVAVLAVVVVVSAITAAYALSANTTETYAYLPEHSVYFYDTAGEYAWASREVDTLAVAGVIKGSGTHLFYPGNAITRADFIVMLDRAYGMSEALDNGQVNSNGSFVDVPSSAYYSKAVIAAKAFGIAAGTATGEFQPQQSMTRQDAMVFLKRTIDRTALKLGTGSVSSFSDASRISNYAKPSVSALVGAKVIGGSKGKINPLSKVTRAEMAVMLYRATHLTVQSSGAVYQSRCDLVNLCIGTQNYCDVVIENYDPSVTYTGLMEYTDFQRIGGVTYVSLSGKRAIDRTVTYTNGVFTFADGEGTVSIPAAADCVAIDVSQPYHQLNAPTSTGSNFYGIAIPLLKTVRLPRFIIPRYNETTLFSQGGLRPSKTLFFEQPSIETTLSIESDLKAAPYGQFVSLYNSRGTRPGIRNLLQIYFCALPHESKNDRLALSTD